MVISDLKVGDKFISEKLNVDNKQTICTLISYQGMNNYVIDAAGCLLLADGDDEIDMYKDRVWWVVEKIGLLPEYKDEEDQIEEEIIDDWESYEEDDFNLEEAAHKAFYSENL